MQGTMQSQSWFRCLWVTVSLHLLFVQTASVLRPTLLPAVRHAVWSYKLLIPALSVSKVSRFPFLLTLILKMLDLSSKLARLVAQKTYISFGTLKGSSHMSVLYVDRLWVMVDPAGSIYWHSVLGHINEM
jgi:hypothetical protein